ncbi:MAG: RluA family pseudouridine synthase [Helicobacteraceae bacterium]|jgi:23S rRNA pseudouridine1911/1915/1917 synthase|nr:RluA family pseudouridine synthase [Helicobacteraceae bacterium]
MRYIVQSECRADRFVADTLKIGRAEAMRLIQKEAVLCGSAPIAKAARKLKIGEAVTIDLPAAQPQNEAPIVDFDIPILYEDDDLLVINKPSGVVVHSAPSHKGATLVDWLKAKQFTLSTISGDERAGIVHRIDKETTGALAIAKSDRAHKALAKQLENRAMGRIYLAVIDCALTQNRIVDRPIGRHRQARTKMAIVQNGRAAKSAFIALAELKHGRSLIAAKLFSGRTHQIRVHLQSIGAHIVGDTRYGYKSPKDKIVPIFLHAYTLYFIHPTSGAAVRVSAPLNACFANLLDKSLTKEKQNETLDINYIEREFDRLCGLRENA